MNFYDLNSFKRNYTKKLKQKAKKPKFFSFLFPLFQFPTVSKEPNKIQIYPFELTSRVEREREKEESPSRALEICCF